MKYKVKVPVMDDMSPFSTIAKGSSMETPEENALWDYNSAREHDGLPPLKKLPHGTTFELIYE